MTPRDDRTETGTLAEIALSGAVVVTSATGLRRLRDRVAGGATHLHPGTLERSALERLAPSLSGDSVVGVGGGAIVDAAKYLAHLAGLPLTVVPTSTASSAPYSNTAVVRHRRAQQPLSVDPAERVVVDIDLLATAPRRLACQGVGELVAAPVALRDWELAASREAAPRPPVAVREWVAETLDELRAKAGEVAAATPTGLAVLVRRLAELASWGNGLGDRRLSAGSPQALLEAWEHRLGRPADYGAMLALASVAMSVVHDVDPAPLIDVIDACGVDAHPLLLDVDEGTFTGVLRHTVRYAVGEELAYSVLHEADLNTTLAADAWAALWRLRRSPGVGPDVAGG